MSMAGAKIIAVSLFSDVQEAVSVVREATPVVPTVGVILGSGLGAFATQVNQRTVIPYAQVPYFPQSTVSGHAGELVIGKIETVPCAVMSGRVHFYEGQSMERVTFSVRVLAGLGTKTLVVTNAAGGINPNFAPGDIMVITDHINLTGHNPLRGPNDERLGPRFPDMTRVYTPECQKTLHAVAHELKIKLQEGVYLGLIGPSYETPAEIRMLGRMGADAVGMSTVAEVIVAAHAGLKVAGLSIITNRAAGLSGEPLSHDEVKEIGTRVQKNLIPLLTKAVVRLG
jgi:purine-nucleoside phosphorylase